MKKSKFQLIDQRLLEVNYKINEDFDAIEQLNLDIRTETMVAISDNENEAVVTLKLYVFKDSEFSKVPFTLETGMSGIFNWDPNLEQDKVKMLLNINAPAVLLSYIRPFVTQFTAFSGYPPLIIPLLDFSNNKIIKNEKDS